MTNPANTTKNILWINNGRINFERNVPVDRVEYELAAIRADGLQPWVENVPFEQH